MGGFKADARRTDKVQGSHTDTVVVLARLFSNSTPSPLSRAITAYQHLDLAASHSRRPCSKLPKRSLQLNAVQLTRLVQRYQSGATVYELATEFKISRHTVSQRLQEKGVTMRRQSHSNATIEMISSVQV